MALLFPLFAVGAMYLLMIRPQQQRVARQRALVQAIGEGDEVVTAGGIIGRVTRLDDDRATIEVAPGVKITILRGAIAQRVGPDVVDDDDDDDDLDATEIAVPDDVAAIDDAPPAPPSPHDGPPHTDPGDSGPEPPTDGRP